MSGTHNYDSSKIVLSTGVSLSKWKSGLQAKLAKNNVIGHVFHDYPGIRPIVRPADPTEGLAHDDPKFNAVLEAHLHDLEVWTLGEISAKNIIINRLESSMCPRTHDHMTARQLYDGVANTRKETATAPYALALETFLRTRFVSQADDYIDRFQANLQSLNEAADTLHATTGTEYHVTKGQAAAIFVLGTKHVPWLSNWRDLRACTDENSYTSLESMMSTIRVVDGHRVPPPNHIHANATNPAFVMHASSNTNGPNDDCKRCKHRHKNRECFKQHPELAVGPAGERWLARRASGRIGSNKGRVNTVNGIDTDSDSDTGLNDVVIAATAAAHNETIAI